MPRSAKQPIPQQIDASHFLHLKIILDGTKPPIWRMVQVPARLTLNQLHKVIQRVFGWRDCHLWEFSKGAQAFPFGGRREEKLPTSRFLFDVFSGGVQEIDYLYDFGDSWEHRVVLKSVSEQSNFMSDAPRCVKAKGLNPVDDCGGIPGLYALWEILANPKHPEHDAMRNWCENICYTFSPDAQYDFPLVNEALDRIGRSRGKQLCRKNV